MRAIDIEDPTSAVLRRRYAKTISSMLWDETDRADGCVVQISAPSWVATRLA